MEIKYNFKNHTTFKELKYGDAFMLVEDIIDSVFIKICNEDDVPVGVSLDSMHIWNIGLDAKVLKKKAVLTIE